MSLSDDSYVKIEGLEIEESTDLTDIRKEANKIYSESAKALEDLKIEINHMRSQEINYWIMGDKTRSHSIICSPRTIDEFESYIGRQVSGQKNKSYLGLDRLNSSCTKERVVILCAQDEVEAIAQSIHQPEDSFVYILTSLGPITEFKTIDSSKYIVLCCSTKNIFRDVSQVYKTIMLSLLQPFTEAILQYHKIASANPNIERMKLVQGIIENNKATFNVQPGKNFVNKRLTKKDF